MQPDLRMVSLLTGLRRHNALSSARDTLVGGAVDVKRAAELYAQGWTLSETGAERCVQSNIVHDHLRRAGVTMRPVGAHTHPTSTQEILDMRDQGLTWTEVARRVDMTVSGAWSRYRNARPPKPPRLGRWQQVFAQALDQNLAVGVRATVIDHLGRAPTRAELNAARRAAHSFASTGRARVLYVPGADPDDASGDRSYLVLAKPNVIMNDIRLRGLGVAGSHAAGRKTPHNHAQAVRNLRRTLRNAAAGAQLIQADGLNNKSAAELAADLADTLAELHLLQRGLNRRIKRDREHRQGIPPGSVDPEATQA
jgi:hypothetical protein